MLIRVMPRLLSPEREGSGKAIQRLKEYSQNILVLKKGDNLWVQTPEELEARATVCEGRLTTGHKTRYKKGGISTPLLKWLGDKDSNLNSWSQSPLSYH